MLSTDIGEALASRFTIVECPVTRSPCEGARASLVLLRDLLGCRGGYVVARLSGFLSTQPVSPGAVRSAVIFKGNSVTGRGMMCGQSSFDICK